jgi:hypothetical protein
LKPLLNFFVDLCLLRVAPQDLPGSSVLLVLTSLLNVLTGLVLIVGTRVGPDVALLEGLFEAGLMLTVLYVGLSYHGLRMRFQQAATALMGSQLLIGMLALPLVAWNNRAQSGEAGLLLLILMVWNMVVMGHILRHTFETRLILGIGIAVLYTLVSWNLTFMLFPVVI